MAKTARSSASRYKASGADATTTTASSSDGMLLPLPPNASSPSGMLRALCQGPSAVVATIASPFRRGSLPIRAIDGSPSESVGLSDLTTFTSVDRESEESIQQQAARDYAEKGDGDDSDEEGEECNLHYLASSLQARPFVVAEDVEDCGLDEDDDGEEIFSIPGAPDGWAPPQPTPLFPGYRPKANSNAPPSFELVDNPGGWSAFMFQPKYSRSGQYDGHFTPAGAKVLPAELSTGVRSINKWTFHYAGFEGDEFTWKTYRRVGATAENMKPKYRGPKLDVYLLDKHGINSNTIQSPIHFYQLLLPLCDPERSGINVDGRMPFWTTATDCTNLYATCEKGWGGGYSHTFKTVTVPELVKWAAVPIRHGARGGNPTTLHYRWMASDPDYDPKIVSAITQTRWCQVKQVFKLQNNFVEPSRGSPGYNPAFRYDPIYKALCHNMNYFTKQADEDFGVDESTWGFMGYSGECGGRLINKMVAKGGQTTFVFDCTRRWPCAYVHRNKSMERPAGFNTEGPAEMYHLINAINAMVHGTPDSTNTYRNHRGQEISYPIKKIYHSPPHGTADNHCFSGEAIMDYAGGLGFGLTMTCHRDRFPPGLKPYLHHDKTTQKDQRAKCMRFAQPIVAIKKVEETDNSKAYTRTFVSFQSTGATNISGVNNLPSCSLSVNRRERGIGDNKRTWGIEWNEARSLYLKTYWAVDNVDHMIKNAALHYKTWKYWHAPYNHAHAMAIIAAYDMYKYCCKGFGDPDWFVEESNRMSVRDFCMMLLAQMLEWNPSTGLLPGDSHFRYYTKLSTEQKTKRKQPDQPDYECDGVSEANYSLAKSDKRQRLCGDLDVLIEHTESMVRKTNLRDCEVCGKKTLWRCQKCSKSLCVLEKGAFAGGTCMLRFHSDSFFGLAKSDAKMHDIATWRPSNKNKIKRHATYMRALADTMKVGDGLDLDDIDLGDVEVEGV